MHAVFILFSVITVRWYTEEKKLDILKNIVNAFLVFNENLRYYKFININLKKNRK